MDNGTIFSELLSTIIRSLIIPVIPVITTYIVSIINKYTEEITNKLDSDVLTRYTQIAENSIITAIYTVYQTYIDDILKRNNELTPEEINHAFNMIKERSLKLIGHSVSEELQAKVKDLDIWLENKISYYLSPEVINGQSTNSTELEALV